MSAENPFDNQNRDSNDGNEILKRTAGELGLPENATQDQIDEVYEKYESLTPEERERIDKSGLKMAQALANSGKIERVEKVTRNERDEKVRHRGAKVELPLPSSKVPTQENVESGEILEGHDLWRYLKKQLKDKNLGMVATDMGFSGNDWIAFLKEDDGSVEAVQIYSAGKYDEAFIKKIIGFGETSKYISGSETADQICERLERGK